MSRGSLDSNPPLTRSYREPALLLLPTNQQLVLRYRFGLVTGKDESVEKTANEVGMTKREAVIAEREGLLNLKKPYSELLAKKV